MADLPRDRILPTPPRARLVRRRRGRNRSGGAGGLPAIYADPALAIAFTDSDPEWHTYAGRVARAARRYTYMAVVGQTYADFTADFDALDATEKAAVMVNLEYPWLEILMQRDDEGVDAAWLVDAAVLAEGTRQSITIDGGTTLAQFRTLAITLWREATTYALANGCSMVMHYGSAGLSFSEPTGAPWGGWAETARPSGRTYWLSDAVSHPSAEEKRTTISTQNGMASLIAAQRGATHHGVGMYCFVPSGDYADEIIDEWTEDGIVRKNTDGETVTPDYERDDLDHWTAVTSKWWPRLYVDFADDALADEAIEADDYPSSIAAMVFGPGIQAAVGDFRNRQQWAGLGMKTIDGYIGNEITPLYTDPTEDADKNRRPDALVVWADMRYYFVTEVIRARTAGGDLERQTNIMRFAMEAELFGRDRDPAGDGFPFGETTQATLDAWYEANSLGDGWWNTDAEGDWWTVAGGSQLPAGLTLDSSCPLAPWLDFTADIGRAEVVTALRHYVSEKSVKSIEAASAVVASRTPVGG
jgi:hypothetical protein